MSTTEKAPDIEVAPAVPDEPVRCMRVKFVLIRRWGFTLLWQRQCRQTATWDEVYSCPEGTSYAHRCDPHHTQAVAEPIWCGPHDMRHHCHLVASYPRRA